MKIECFEEFRPTVLVFICENIETEYSIGCDFDYIFVEILYVEIVGDKLQSLFARCGMFCGYLKNVH